MIQYTDSLIPVEVKASDNATASLNHLINDDTYDEVKYGIKFGNKTLVSMESSTHSLIFLRSC